MPKELNHNSLAKLSNALDILARLINTLFIIQAKLAYQEHILNLLDIGLR